MTPDLQRLVQLVQRHLYLPDPAPVLVTLGTIAANRLDGDPAWLLLVGSPGNLKTEILRATTSLPKMHSVSTLTEAGLLSGSSRSDRPEDATGGILREMGPLGIIVCKDFTSILSGPREKRAQVLAALREIYDGSWTRVLGTDGGLTLSWSGKAGFLGGVTPIIDTHHSVMTTMGDRFVLFRMPDMDESSQAEAALDHSATGDTMRRELAEAVKDFMSGLDLEGAGPPRAEAQTKYLTSLAALVARARSTVVRDGRSRDVELVLPPEAPTRITIVFDRLRAGLQALGVAPQPAGELLGKVAFDCMPVIRSRVLRWMACEPESDHHLRSIAKAVGHPDQTTRRHLEDLELHGLLKRVAHGPGSADDWALSELAAGLMAQVPERPEGNS